MASGPSPPSPHHQPSLSLTCMSCLDLGWVETLELPEGQLLILAVPIHILSNCRAELYVLTLQKHQKHILYMSMLDPIRYRL